MVHHCFVLLCNRSSAPSGIQWHRWCASHTFEKPAAWHAALNRFCLPPGDMEVFAAGGKGAEAETKDCWRVEKQTWVAVDINFDGAPKEGRMGEFKANKIWLWVQTVWKIATVYALCGVYMVTNNINRQNKMRHINLEKWENSCFLKEPQTAAVLDPVWCSLELSWDWKFSWV